MLDISGRSRKILEPVTLKEHVTTCLEKFEIGECLVLFKEKIFGNIMLGNWQWYLEDDKFLWTMTFSYAGNWSTLLLLPIIAESTQKPVKQLRCSILQK